MALKQVCSPEQCSGCFACMSICPKGAIHQVLNKLGEEKPAIDPEKCISCGLCVSTCPVNSNQDMRRAEFCYAAWSKFGKDIEKSSSGGIAAVLSRKMLEDGGIVYGSVSRDSKVLHERIDSVDGIELTRGSKYVISDMKSCFSRIGVDINAGKKVLFIGTPCQTAAVKSVIGKHKNNLYTVDLICHGTPPFTYLKEHLDRHLSGKKWDSVSFRSKNAFLMRVFHSGTLVYEKPAADDLYYSAFLDSMIFRENCYTCRYACPERVGDLTIGDFWGIDRSKLHASHTGKISLILPNSPKGNALIESCRDNLNLNQLPLEDAMNPEQGNLLHPSVPHTERALFEKLYPQYGFYGALKRTQFGKKIIRRKYAQMVRSSFVYRAIRKVLKKNLYQ